MRRLGAVAGVGLLLLSGCGLFDETASLDTSIDPAEPLDVVVQVGDYFCCNIDDFLFGPWLVVYADGSFYRERQIGVADGVAELETVTGQLDDAGFESITEAANVLPGSRSVGTDQQASDGVPVVLVAGDATLETLHTLDDPYWGFVGEVERGPRPVRERTVDADRVDRARPWRRHVRRLGGPDPVLLGRCADLSARGRPVSVGFDRVRTEPTLVDRP